MGNHPDESKRDREQSKMGKGKGQSIPQFDLASALTKKEGRSIRKAEYMIPVRPNRLNRLPLMLCSDVHARVVAVPHGALPELRVEGVGGVRPRVRVAREDRRHRCARPSLPVATPFAFL